MLCVLLVINDVHNNIHIYKFEQFADASCLINILFDIYSIDLFYGHIWELCFLEIFSLS